MLEQVIQKFYQTTGNIPNGSHPREFDKIGFSNDPSNDFYVAMLSISLIIGIAYCSYAIYNYWYKGRTLLGIVVALVISSLLRTFFSLLLWSIFVLGESTDWPGSNTLLAFEGYFLVMVFSYSLVLTVYLHECVDNSFNSEPSLKLFHYGIPGVATFFALVWTFILAGESDNWLVILIIPGYRWIMFILILLYLCIQLGLTLNMGIMIVPRKSTYDAACLNLMRRAGLVLLGILALLWLHFGFLVANVPGKNTEVYLYFLYLVDGLQCAFLCPMLYFLEKWGQELSDKLHCDSTVFGRHNPPPVKTQEMLIKNLNKPVDISTIESVYRDRSEVPVETETQDIVYSNVVSPERLHKTFDLYKRFGIILANEVTVISGEKFYECGEDDAKTVYNDCISKESDRADSEGGQEPPRGPGPPVEKDSKPGQKKNAFYASRYLVINQDHDNNLGNENSKARDSFESLESQYSDKMNYQGLHNSGEMIEKWLENNNSSN